MNLKLISMIFRLVYVQIGYVLVTIEKTSNGDQIKPIACCNLHNLGFKGFFCITLNARKIYTIMRRHHVLLGEMQKEQKNPDSLSTLNVPATDM